MSLCVEPSSRHCERRSFLTLEGSVEGIGLSGMHPNPQIQTDSLRIECRAIKNNLDAKMSVREGILKIVSMFLKSVLST